MPVSFDTFKESCSERGYVSGVVDQSVYTKGQNIYAMRTKNQIKTEIKPKWYTVGYGRNEEDLNILREELTTKGYNIGKINSSCFNIDYKKGDTGEHILSTFWNIVTELENIDAIVGKRVGIGRKVFTREEADASIFEKIAKRYRFAIDNSDQDLLDLARDLLSSDKIDHIITIGQSKNGSIDSYREHIVPCIMIHNQSIDMTLAGKSIAEIAQMIKSNLAIVRVSDNEQETMDNKLNLRTSMPTGWNFGDDVFARLKLANVELL